MAETEKTVKKAEKAAATKSNLVEIFVPKGSAREQSAMFISINGKNTLLPRGQKHMVKPEVAEEFYRAMEAQNKFDEVCANLQQASK